MEKPPKVKCCGCRRLLSRTIKNLCMGCRRYVCVRCVMKRGHHPVTI